MSVRPNFYAVKNGVTFTEGLTFIDRCNGGIFDKYLDFCITKRKFSHYEESQEDWVDATEWDKIISLEPQEGFQWNVSPQWVNEITNTKLFIENGGELFVNISQ